MCPKAGLGFLAGLEKGCALFSAYGTRVTSCADLKPEEDTVFMVPNGRLFMIPTQGYMQAYLCIHTYIHTYIHYSLCK